MTSDTEQSPLPDWTCIRDHPDFKRYVYRDDCDPEDTWELRLDRHDTGWLYDLAPPGELPDVDAQSAVFTGRDSADRALRDAALVATDAVE